MQLVKTRTLFDGISERKDIFIGFEGDEIKYVGSSKSVVEGNTNDVIIEADTITPGFIDSHSHIGMARSGEPGRQDEANEQMKTVYPLINSLHSIYMDDPSFGESVENGVIYSTVLPGCGNIIGGKAVLVRNFSRDIGDAYVMDVGIKVALGYNPRSTTEWKGERPSTRMGAIAMLRENFIKARKCKDLFRKKRK